MWSRRAVLTLVALATTASASAQVVVPKAAIGCTDISTASPLCVAGLPNITGVLIGATPSGDIGNLTSISGDPSFTGNLTIGGTLDVTGGVTLSSTLDVTGDTMLTGRLEVLSPASFPGLITSHLVPTLTDSYDLGTSVRLWRQGFVSQLNAVIFAEETASLIDGWLIVGKTSGTLQSQVNAGSTTVNFGRAMTAGAFVLIRAYDMSNTPKAEYLQVGALVGGTTYNVTRDLAAMHGTDPTWAEGTPYLVLGVSGDGRLELNAYDLPRLSILVQGATYNAQTEVVRIGYLSGMPGIVGDPIGVFVGNASNYLTYHDGALTIATSTTCGSSGTCVRLSTDGLKGYVGSTEQFSLSATTGVATAGAGAVTLNSSGVVIALANIGGGLTTNAYQFNPGTAAGSMDLRGWTNGTSRQMDLMNWTTTTGWEVVTDVSVQYQPASPDNVARLQLVANATGGYASVSGQTWTRIYGGPNNKGVDMSDSGLAPINGPFDLGNSLAKFGVPYFSLSGAASAFVAVATKADGALYYVAGFDGCLSGRTVIGGIVTSTECP